MISVIFMEEREPKDWQQCVFVTKDKKVYLGTWWEPWKYFIALTLTNCNFPTILKDDVLCWVACNDIVNIDLTLKTL